MNTTAENADQLERDAAYPHTASGSIGYILFA
jgi:hypothetical protein